jgi:hypothetical protein
LSSFNLFKIGYGPNMVRGRMVSLPTTVSTVCEKGKKD